MVKPDIDDTQEILRQVTGVWSSNARRWGAIRSVRFPTLRCLPDTGTGIIQEA